MANTKFISRQEDFGLPELRKTKYHYHPLYKTEKHACIINSDYRDFYLLDTEAIAC
ncbi:MAG: hypothetical protein WC251_05590 [Candidatus Izemoplasmatales bacterium]